MTILYVIIAAIALVLIVAALLPKTFELKAETIIHKPKQQVRDYTKLFANQVNYSVRVMADPQVKLTHSGVDGTVGTTQARDSVDNNVGKGEQEIIAINEGTSIEVEVRFERPMKAINYATNSFESIDDNTTKISQVFKGKNPRPGNIISALFLPKVQKDMQQNINNLKVILEK